MREVVDIPDGYYYKRSLVNLLKLREEFMKENKNVLCTCDYCIDVTRCGCAFDEYNVEGECLLVK